MQTFNPYLIDEIVTQSDGSNSFFGLISRSENNKTEMHGYEITMSGRLVLPELKPQPEREEQNLSKTIVC